MPVEKTASPKVSPSAPKDSPWKVRPSSRTSIAGFACSGTPYLLARLTGRSLKGVRAQPTLPAPVPPLGRPAVRWSATATPWPFSSASEEAPAPPRDEHGAHGSDRDLPCPQAVGRRRRARAARALRLQREGHPRGLLGRRIA